MKTKQIYYEQPYATEVSAIVLTVEMKGANALIELDQTIFFPRGGGQESDVGEIIGSGGALRVESVNHKEGRIIHQGRLRGGVCQGDQVRLKIKWSHRHHGMRVHSAGHALHESVLALTDKLMPLSANHGSNAYIEYKGAFNTDVREEIERRVNELVDANVPVSMCESSFDEIKAKCRFIPTGLPNRPLRTVQIGVAGDLVPCGGIHVAFLGEVGRVVVIDVRLNVESGNTTLKYRVTKADGSASTMPKANEEVVSLLKREHSP